MLCHHLDASNHFITQLFPKICGIRQLSILVNFLKSYFQSDDSKEYHLVDKVMLANERKKGQNTHIFTPCRKFQLIAVSSEGQFHRELYLCDLKILSKIFNKNSPIEMRLDEDDGNDKYEDKSEQTEFYLDQNTVFEIIEPGTFVGMKSPPNAIEPFFVAEILQKGTTEEDLHSDVTCL